MSDTWNQHPVSEPGVKHEDGQAADEKGKLRLWLGKVKNRCGVIKMTRSL